MKGTIEEANIIIDCIANADDGIGGDLVSELRVRMSPDGRAQWLVAAAKEWMNTSDDCIWTEDADGIWETACENAHEFSVDGVAENGYRYCPYCGKTIVAKLYKEVEG